MEEFERTYLPKKDLMPDLRTVPFKEMLDIYIPVSSEHPVLRIRMSGDRYEMTKKQPVKDGDASYQLETTIPLTKEEFSDLSTLQGKRISKRRYLYSEGKYMYEIDVFQGPLKGLVLVDVEFGSEKAKDAFESPAWLLADVTQETFIAGGMVCGKRYEDIAPRLETLGYKAIN
jgi:CYTH domain-containing protein